MILEPFYRPSMRRVAGVLLVLALAGCSAAAVKPASKPSPSPYSNADVAAIVARAKAREAAQYQRQLLRQQARREARPVRVDYVLFGSASTATITYTTPSGMGQRDIQVPSAAGPRISVKMHHGDFADFSAQNGGSSGTLTCEILAAGHRISRVTSAGAYAITDCSAEVP